jgi:CheY-like chemotaxis protein
MAYPTILYVEDDEMNREGVQTLLAVVLGYNAPGQVVCFEDSSNIVERVRALPRQPDLILLDIQMYPFDGVQVLKMLRMLPEYQHTPIAAFTASLMTSEVNRLRSAGFDGCIAKPFELQQFTDAIHSLLAGQSIWITH